jgi:hypothetical protein
MTPIKDLRDVMHVASYAVDTAKLLAAFGISPGAGVTHLNLKVASADMVELTVRRYITQPELDALMVALEQEPRPVLVDTLSVKHTFPCV